MDTARQTVHGQSKPTIRHQAPVDPPMPFPTLQQPVEALSITERQLPGESHRTETVNGLKLLYLSNSLNYVCECTDIVFCLFICLMLDITSMC